MVSISVVIITLNEEKNLSRCLQSIVPIADEIIIVDSFSQDKTVEIAKGFGALVYSHPFNGFVQQKIIATGYAKYDWIFTLDADEVLTPELQQSILAFKSNPAFNAYSISRITNYCGKWIKHCGWYPDHIVRLFNKTKGNWHGKLIHEHWEFNDKTEQTGLLQGDMLHYSYDSISAHIKQIEKFTELTARAAVDSGKDSSLLKIWLGPKWLFFTMFFLKLGFLDGYYGYLVCKYSAYASFIKYTKMRQYNEQKRKGNYTTQQH